MYGSVMWLRRKFYFIIIFGVVTHSKTIRSKIYTNENGTRELIFHENSDVKKQEIDFLLKNLAMINITADNMKVQSTTEASQPETTTTMTKKDEEILNENILMQHWNALTEVGWKYFQRHVHNNGTRLLNVEPEIGEKNLNKTEEGVDVYLNNSREVGDEDVNVTDVEVTLRKPRLDIEESATAVFDLCQAIVDICHLEISQTNVEELRKCLITKNETFLHLVEEKLKENENLTTCLENGSFPSAPPQLKHDPNNTNSNGSLSRTEKLSSRAFIRPRRLLHKLLLPLLVIIVIKYLVTLPFVAVSAFTLNAMWLGMLSLGAVLFSKLKGHDRYYSKLPTRRLNHLHGPDLIDIAEPISASEFIWSPIKVPVAAHSRADPQ